MSIYDPIFNLLDNGSIVLTSDGAVILMLFVLYAICSVNLLTFILNASCKLLAKLFAVIKSKFKKSKEKEGINL